MLKHWNVTLALFAFVMSASGCCCFDRAYRPSQFVDNCTGNCVGCAFCEQTCNQLGACAGCGDVYWGEWISDPPDRCDPCDGCGNWIGPRCCPPRIFNLLTCSLSSLWGSRFCGDSCCGQGCSSCGGDIEPWDGVELHGVPPHSGAHVTPRQPTPAPLPNANEAPNAAPETLQAPQPMPGPQTMKSRQPRHSTKSIPVQSTRSKRPAPTRSANVTNRSRTL
jgi:hypothetical protein